MKLRVMICAMAASAGLFADDVSTPVFGMMRVYENASSNTVVGVPWVGINNSDVTLSNLVSTATLSNGDVMYFCDGEGKWHAYTVNSGVWEGATTISSSGIALAPADTRTVSRGTGLLIQRASTNAAIYLCGRYTGDAVSTTIPAKSVALIANPTATDKILAIDFGSVGDQVLVPLNAGGTKMYTRKSGGWEVAGEASSEGQGGRPGLTPTTIGTCTISAGKGAWYKNTADSAVTIAW